MSDWRVLLVSIDDTTGDVTEEADFANATVLRCRDVLNDIGELTFSLPLHDPLAPLVGVLPAPPNRREIQAWEGDEEDPSFWGVVVGFRADASSVTFDCMSIELYFRQRKPGPAAQTEVLGNPSFEERVGIIPTVWIDATGPGSAATLDSTPPYPALHLDRSLHAHAADVGADRFVYQAVTITAPASGALRFEVSVWWKALPIGLGTTFQNRGLLVARYTWPGLVFIEEAHATLTPATVDDQWHRMSVEMAVDKATTQAIYVHLYVPTGFMQYDAVSFRRRFATYTIAGEDRSLLAERLVNQAANGSIVANSQGGGPNGDLESEIIHPPVHIRWDTANPLTGNTSPVYIDHDTSTDFLSLLQDFPRQGLADFAIDFGGGTRRTFQTFVPKRGSYRGEHALETGRNIVAPTPFAVGGGGVADQIVPPAADWSNTLPSPTLADRDIWVQSGPTSEASIKDIEAFIPAERARRAVPLPVTSISVQASSEAAQALRVGDTVPVRIDEGYKQVNETLRIVARTKLPPSGLVTYDLARP